MSKEITTLPPLSFATVQEMDDIYKQYVKQCQFENMVLTLPGLLYKLGLTKKQYEFLSEHPTFKNKCREFNQLIENAWVQRLMGSGAQGAMFYLKNTFQNDYKDHYDATVTHISPSPILGPELGQDEATRIIDVTPEEEIKK